MLVDILDDVIRSHHCTLETFGFSCLVVKGHYGSITVRSADELFSCSCAACDAEAAIRLSLKERKKLL